MTLNAIMMTVFLGIFAALVLTAAIGDLLHPPTRRCGKTGRCRMPAPRK